MKSPRYRIASLPHWREYAAQMIAQKKSLAAFLASVHPDNRSTARTAYRMEAAKVRKNPPLASLRSALRDTGRPIRIRVEKITMVSDWRKGSLSWETNVRKAAATKPVFVLRADGRGQLFFPDKGKVRVRTWAKVTVLR